ncbi:MAG: hypothetical protein JRI55_39005, partial [Deltaproteobacteria bacterium]|nr:hypothetical protein [Deltaproteobacteria bacterium]
MTAAKTGKLDTKRLIFTALGILLFVVVYYSPPWPDAVDPAGARHREVG